MTDQKEAPPAPPKEKKKEAPPAPQPVKQEGPSTTTKKPSFQVTSAKKSESYYKMMLYGDLGTGKTVFAASAQDEKSMQDVLFISAEAGDMSISERDDIDIIRINSYSQFADIYEFVRLFCKARDAGDKDKMLKLSNYLRPEEDQLTKKDLKVYKTIVIDSLTEVQKYVMYRLLGTNIGEARLDIPPDQPEFKEWGQGAEMIRLLIRSFRDLPMNVIIVCGENRQMDQMQQIHRIPSLPGKLSNEIGYFLDVVGYMAARPGEGGDLERRLYLQPGKTFTAKCRIRALDGVSFIDEPTMSKLVSATKG